MQALVTFHKLAFICVNLIFFLFLYFPGMVSGKAPPPNPDVLQWPPPAHPKLHIFG